MKCLLINPPVSEEYDIGNCFFPIGLGHIVASLQRAGIQTDILDISIDSLSREQVIQRLKEQLPGCSWVGITGIINGYKYIRWLASQIRSIDPKMIIVLGGSICSPDPKLLLQSTEVDICCIGEGEETVIDIAQLIEGDKAADTVKGIAYKKNGQPVVTERRPLQDNLDELDFPKWEVFNMQKYLSQRIIVLNKSRSMNLIGGRGCPYHCRFCSPNLGRIFRYRSVDSVFGELWTLIEQYGVEHFEFSDELFLMREEFAKDLCKRIIENKFNITWRALGRVNILHRFSDETLKLLKESGCNWIGFGMESGSQKILDLMNKAIKIEHSELAIKRLRSAGIKVSGTFIIGYPGETENTVRETVEFCKRNLLPIWAFTICCPLPGTELYDDCLQKKLITDEIAFWERIDAPLTELILNLTDFSDDKLLQLKKNAEEEINTYASKHGAVSAFE